MRFFVCVALAIIIILLPFTANHVTACSVCRCGDQSFFLNNARQLAPGRFYIALEHFNTQKSAGLTPEPALGLAKLFAPLDPQHDEAGLETHVQNIVQATLSYGLGHRFMFMASVPYAFNRISTTAGEESAHGLGDPEFSGIAQLLEFGGGMWRLQGTAGARLPLGTSDQKDDAGVLLEQHLQAGSGAWAGLFGFQLMHGSGAVPVFLSASYQVNGTNDQNFAYGQVWRFNLAAQKALGSAFDVIAEANARVAGYDREGKENDPNSGGNVVYFSPGIRLRFGGPFSLRTQVQIPVLENLHGEQDEKVNVRTGLVWEL